MEKEIARLEERRVPACTRRQLADEIVFGRLPSTAGKLPALPGIFARNIAPLKTDSEVD